MKIRLKRTEETTQLRLLVDHPMESGRRTDGSGKPIPAHFIQEIIVRHNGEPVATCLLNGSISKDPYLSIRFRGGKPGDQIQVSWTDNLGQSDNATATIR